MSSGLAVGIDLGTTYSCVGVWRNDRVEIIPNKQGNPLTPSCVAFSDQKRLVGEDAKYQARIDPKNTVFDVKRLIGRKFSDPGVQSDMKFLPFTVFDRKGRPHIRVNHQGGTKQFSPEEISAMVLMKMKENAESHLAAPVTNAVITVPSSFNDLQRRATRDAATIAGLSVLYILNEPTAAAIAYGFDTRRDAERNVLIYDFGGGTFNVSLLTVEDGILEVKATAGDSNLGGEDLDNRLVSHLAWEFKRINNRDLSGDPRALRRLRNACERAKRTLSSSSVAYIEIYALFERIDFSTQVTRARFEELCDDLFRSTLEPIEKVLRDSKIDKSHVHEIVLVGGSTRIPRIVKLVSDFFNGRAPRIGMNPDEAVAYGAAIQAAIMSGRTSNKTEDLLLLDVVSNSLGFEGAGGVMIPLMKRNTTVPTKKSEIFTDNPNGMQVHIYEGERARVKDNNFLGKLDFSGLVSARRGVPQFEVTFDLDVQGTFKVSVQDRATGRSTATTITNEHGRLSSEEIDRIIVDTERYKVEQEEIAAARIAAKNRLHSYAKRVQDLIEQKPAQELDDWRRSKVDCAVNDTLQWLNEEYEEKLQELEAITNFYLRDDVPDSGNAD